jgi:hypothetical protein
MTKQHQTARLCLLGRLPGDTQPPTFETVVADLGLAGVSIDRSYGLLELNPKKSQWVMLVYSDANLPAKTGRYWRLLGTTIDHNLNTAQRTAGLRSPSFLETIFSIFSRIRKR